MLRVMLCGAIDTSDVVDGFSDVVTAIGGEPWHYQSGQVLHVNSRSASWDTNSRVTVSRADLCVFVIVREHGSITWSTELREALNTGKPFIVMCLADTYRRYMTLRQSVADPAAITSEADRNLVGLLRELEFERELTIVPFTHQSFTDVLRRQFANLFHSTLKLLEDRNQRDVYIGLLAKPDSLTTSDLAHVSAIAVDELESKNVRKRAILALAARGAADEETVLQLLGSAEQGVQRLTVQSVDTLYTVRPPDPAFLDHCVALANSSEDIGLRRRLVPALLRLDLSSALDALATFEIGDVTGRRRLAESIAVYEEDICALGLEQKALLLLERCTRSNSSSDWLEQCNALQERLRARGAQDDL